MNKKRIIIIVILIIIVISTFSFDYFKERNRKGSLEINPANNSIERLESGLSAAKFEGDYLFEEFLENGGAISDYKLTEFIYQNILYQNAPLGGAIKAFGCSTISTQDDNDNYLFGRNFDWMNSEALIILSKPDIGYSSISTANLDFIASFSDIIKSLPDGLKIQMALYAPLDGMNEKGLAVAVNMIEDEDIINQETDKPDLTTTTVVRLLLNKAATVDEAIELLKKYDVHSSMNLMVHFVLSDNTGKSVVVEYVNNEMQVIEDNVVTNFYLAEGEKYGIGTSQSKNRYQILKDTLEKNDRLSSNELKDALNSVSKHNYNDGTVTEWSIIYNKTTLEVEYYHRENYQKSFNFKII